MASRSFGIPARRLFPRRQVGRGSERARTWATGIPDSAEATNSRPPMAQRDAVSKSSLSLPASTGLFSKRHYVTGLSFISRRKLNEVKRLGSGFQVQRGGKVEGNIQVVNVGWIKFATFIGTLPTNHREPGDIAMALRAQRRLFVVILRRIVTQGRGGRLIESPKRLLGSLPMVVRTFCRFLLVKIDEVGQHLRPLVICLSIVLFHST